MAFIQELSTNLQTYLLSIGIMGAFLSCGIIVAESILPCMPVAIFISILFYTFGSFFGFVMCWLCTILGCVISYKVCRSKLRGFVINKFIVRLSEKNQRRINNIIEYITGLSTTSLTVLMALPFTPAFVVNIAAGLANVRKKKFYTALIIGKAFMVYFWGYVGKSLLESMTNPLIIVKVVAMLVGAYVLSKISSKIFNFD